MPDNKWRELAAEVTGPLARRFSTATVLFHHAVAERLGLGPTDHKCLDLVREHGVTTASQLAAITGLTTGAVTGVVNRLERAGYLRREPDPHDRRRQLLRLRSDRVHRIEQVFRDLPQPTEALVAGFDTDQLATIAEFLRRATSFAHERAALLRAQTLARGGRTPMEER